MQAFTSPRDAKEFLARSIVAQAQRENVPLSEVERKMLYFSETAWTLPDMDEVSNAFDRDCDQERYEQKIGELSRSFRAETASNNPAELDSWNAAVQTLSAEDHYILVLIGAAGAPLRSDMPRFFVLKVVAALMACGLLRILYVALHS